MPNLCDFGSAVVWKGNIYIVDGFQQSCMGYDPVVAQWSTLSQCKHKHANGPALVWKDRILVCGGRGNYAEDDNTDEEEEGEEEDTVISVIEEYDPETDTWTVSQTKLRQKLSSHFVFSTRIDHVMQGYTVSEDKSDMSQNKQTFMIGDATIDGILEVTTGDGKAVVVHALPERTFSEISTELDRAEITNGVGEMFLVCGLSEAGNKQSLEEIKANLVGLVSKAKVLCDSLMVSSVLPSAKRNARINQLNDLIQRVCGELKVNFVDNKNFFFRRNIRDRTAFRGNTNRLTAKGIIRLMGNMGLPVPSLHGTIEKQTHTASTTV